MRYKQFQKVRVVSRHGFFGKLFHSNRQLVGKVGSIVFSEIGKYSGEPMYAVVFEESGKIIDHDVFFENELEQA